MSELFPSSGEMRIPLVNARNRWVLAVGSVIQFGLIVATFANALLDGRAGSWIAVVLIGSMLLAFLGLCLSTLFRYGRTQLILDAQGIWLEGRRRKGIRWEDVAAYETPHGEKAPTLRVRSRNGETFEIPDVFGVSASAELGSITRELDRRLGPDGDRPSLPAIAAPLNARLHHYYGQVPAIELEPGIVYRYIDPKALAEDAKSRAWKTAGIAPLLIPTYALITKFPAFTWPIAALACVAVLAVAVVVAQSLTLAHGFRDRFVRRGDEIWRIRNGRESRLPPSSPGDARPILDQPTTIHGTGPFAYRMAPQFLEPDPEVST